MYNTCIFICETLYITLLFLHEYFLYLHLTYECFLIKHDNKYFHPFSNMSFIYTGFTVKLITGTLYISLIPFTHYSRFFCNFVSTCIPKNQSGRNVNTSIWATHICSSNNRYITVYLFKTATTCTCLVYNLISHGKIFLSFSDN